MQLFQTNCEAWLLKGNVDELLNGITSNVATASRNAFLDRAGRIVVVFWQLRVDSHQTVIFFPEPFAARLRDYLKNYLLLSEVSAEKLRHKVFANSGKPLPKQEGDYLLSDGAWQWVVTCRDLTISLDEAEFTRVRLQF